MPGVVLSIPKLGVTFGGLEKNKELYVLSFAIDNNAADKATFAAQMVGARPTTHA